MTTMTPAPPGDKPHTAVAPGRTRRRIKNQPVKAAAAMAHKVPPMNQGQWAARSPAKVTGMDPAIMQPNRALEKVKTFWGTAISRPLTARTMPADMDPNRREAGSLTARKAAISRAESPASISQRPAAAIFGFMVSPELLEV